MELLQSFIENIRRQHLFTTKDRLIIAASGGVDSTVLCELCKRAGYDFVIAHCNFKLRGKESERDREFVEKLGRKYKVEVKVKEFDTEKFAEENKLSVQEAARKLRYDWFAEFVGSQESGGGSQEAGVRRQEAGGGSQGLITPNSGLRTLLLTAHHADDNIETVLMNFFRGTGLHGLTGIAAKMGDVRRPLLDFRKEQLLAFAKENKLEFVEDSSNLSSKYTRNFFRNEIIPAVSKAYPAVNENLLDNIRRLREIESLYKTAVAEIKKKLCKQKGKEVHIPVKQLTGFRNKALIYEIIKEYGFHEKQVEEVVKLCDSGSGRYISSDDYRIIKHRHWLIISPVDPLLADNILINEGIDNLLLAIGNIQIKKISIADCRLPVDKWQAVLDKKEIHFPILLRKWKAGDYFYPLGMKKKKKLSRFFIDQKLSKSEKENVWVAEMDKKIIWVAGHRIDERFKVTDKTAEVLQITIKRKELL